MVTSSSLDPIIGPGWVVVVGTVVEDGGGAGIDVDVDGDVVVGLEGVVIAGVDLGPREVLVGEEACDPGEAHPGLVLAQLLTVGSPG